MINKNFAQTIFLENAVKQDYTHAYTYKRQSAFEMELSGSYKRLIFAKPHVSIKPKHILLGTLRNRSND